MTVSVTLVNVIARYILHKIVLIPAVGARDHRFLDGEIMRRHTDVIISKYYVKIYHVVFPYAAATLLPQIAFCAPINTRNAKLLIKINIKPHNVM